MTNSKKIISIVLLAVFVFTAVLAMGVFVQSTAFAEEQTVDVYAINDFHGAVEKMPRIAGYLAKRKAEGAVVLNSGDMFQGSMESNSNFGRLLTECMKEADFDAMTYGNHEFDWGMDNLRTLSAESGIPFLGANIYNWDRNSGWGDFADDFADKYVIVQSGDFKVGVIGVIGSDQITSISSQLVQSIGFKDPLPIIKDLAMELRDEQGCDIVVASVHAGPQDIVDGSGGTYDKPTTSADLENYVDAMFCAHTHSEQRYLVNGLPFLQGGQSGAYVSHVQFGIDNGNVTVKTYENISYTALSDVDTTVQNKVQTLIDNSNAEIETQRQQVLGTLSAQLSKSDGVPRLVCNAIAEYAYSQNYTIDLAIVNVARNAIGVGQITYSRLYEALPFDNEVYIALVQGKDIIKEMGYPGQSMWRMSGRKISDNEYYLVAVIDYLLYHQNTSRKYNYFPSAFESGFDPVPLKKEGVDMYNYRLITKDFLLSQTEAIDAKTYTVESVHTDADLLEQSVDLPIVAYQYGKLPAPDGVHTPNPAGLPPYAIALIVVGAVLVVGAIVAVAVVVTVRKRRAQ